MPVTKTIHLNNAQRLQLFHATRNIPAKDMAEIRKFNRLYREYGLLEIESAVIALGDAPKTQDEAAAQNAAFAKAFDVTGPAQPFEISEAGAAILRGYLDRGAELFPARKDQFGNDIPAGLPAATVRALAPVVDALDEQWPVAEGKAA